MLTFIVNQKVPLSAPAPASGSGRFKLWDRDTDSERFVQGKVGDDGQLRATVRLHAGWWTIEAQAGGLPYFRDAIYVKP